MAITLRVNKGAALTYNEMDLNFSSFFYSASLANNNSTLVLHYTGSTLQAPSSISIPLDASGSTSQVAGSNSAIQYNASGNFGADASNFIYNTTEKGIAIGTNTVPQGYRLQAYNGVVGVDEGELRISSGSVSASLFIDEGSDDLIVKHTYSDNNADIRFIVKDSLPALTLKGDQTVGFRGAYTGHADVTISGSLAIGTSLEDAYRTKINSFSSAETRIENNVTTNNLPGNSRGVIIEGPQGGHVVVGLQTEAGSLESAGDTFSVLSGFATASQDPTYHRNVASFKAGGAISFADANFESGYTLTVSGSITSSGDLNIGNDIIAEGAIIAQNGLTASNGLHVSGTLGVEGLGSGTPGIGYDILVAESNEVKTISAGVVPVGAIIMWSGINSTIPSGWHLCNGTNGTPDLTDRFIIGAGNTIPVNATGGSNTHDHGGTTGAHTLTSSEIPAHTHTYKDSYYVESSNPGQGSGGTITGADYIGPTKYKGSGDSDNDNDYVFYRTGTTNENTGGSSHTHTVETASNIPEYYALSFIMYTGA